MNDTSPLQQILAKFRSEAVSEREKGTYFEELILTYLRNEATYKDLYEQVWMYADWAKEQGIDARDTGIDLVAKTQGTHEYHAIQCKFYAEDYKVQKGDIDSFFTASGKKPFTYRVIVTTTNNWSEHAEHALQGQTPPVTKIDLYDLENSQIDWAKYQPKQKATLKPKKHLRPHQTEAVRDVISGLKNADRGKLIMACGTGKTFTSLKIAEQLGGPGKRILFLVPSLSLLSQSLTEWTQESDTPLHSFAVCSDSEIGNKRKKEDESVETFSHELRYPATTDAKRLAIEFKKRHETSHMSVVFSTYHSIEVLSKAQKTHGLDDFDLIICDEAHRTTGATFDDADESAFVKVHDQKFLKGTKRLYMTATPRIYGEIAKVTAQKDSITLCSMDDEKLFGRELYVITFSEAVKEGLLVDYKVIVLAVDEAHVNLRLQKLLSDEDNQIKVDDAAKIVGCWKALSKQGTQENLSDDLHPMQKAVAFCQVIEYQKGAKTHKVSSKLIAGMFQSVVEAYQETDPEAKTLLCEAQHVDGSMNATEKEAKLQWLKANTDENVCRILSNVRCLSEGVDVPALDAVLFLTPRNSQVDVVQSVGRVMRMAPNKKRGYVILPVVIPAGIEPHEALADNKTYKVVWQVLQALRSHDDRFDAMINKLELIGPDPSKMEVVAVSDTVPKRKSKESKGSNADKTGRNNFAIGNAIQRPPEAEQTLLKFEIGEIERAIYAKVVQKCGNRHHWEDWAGDIAKIANTHISRINAILKTPANKSEIKAFADFAEELRDDLNDSISDAEVIEMLAQHLITKPVFDALFSDYKFAKQNPVSNAMDKVLRILEKHHIDKEADTLQRFYDSVALRASGIDNAQGKQRIIVELYDKFFRNAFPKMTERLGIVYTPIEVVDFIIHSVNHLLNANFGQTLGSDSVHIIDPFTGTGTFITRLLQSGLISKADLPKKYSNEIHANEIVLLAYYIAAINIEAAYHTIIGGEYVPFEGICLTDTFQLYEKDDLISRILVDNSNRRTKQKALDIRVIVCNPPYSGVQESANDNNQNIRYPGLDARIAETYAQHSNAVNKNALYDSYIRAIRWASDRIGDNGILGFVTNAGWIDGSAMDGLRKCLAEEFSSIYVFHLRGNGRTSGERCRREGHPLFAAHGGKGGSLTPIAISFFVKSKAHSGQSGIYFHDIGDYLKRNEKLKIIEDFKSVEGIQKAGKWNEIKPDKFNDWVNQRDESFFRHISMGGKKSEEKFAMFANYSRGLETGRDAWVYNYSQKLLTTNIHRFIDFYNHERDRYREAVANLPKDKWPKVDDFVSHDPTKLSWSSSLKQDFTRGTEPSFSKENITVGMYRPFTKQFLYFDPVLNHRVGQMANIFPNAASENRVICLSGVGAQIEFSALMTDVMPNMHTIQTAQCFPMYLYDTHTVAKAKLAAEEADLFSGERKDKKRNPDRRESITDDGLRYIQSAYPNEKISKQDIFYYIYGLLHSPIYRERYADNLLKELPRIPCVKAPADFWAYAESGRKLAELHINYEQLKMYPVKISAAKPLTNKDYRVTQMKFAKNGKDHNMDTILYNEFITISEIPLEAYKYIVNGKSAIEWIMERYCVSTNKESGIVNDANLWATETEKNPKYILELIQRIITVSLETMKIVKALPLLQLSEDQGLTT